MLSLHVSDEIVFSTKRNPLSAFAPGNFAVRFKAARFCGMFLTNMLVEVFP